MKVTPLDIQQQQFKGKMFGGLDQDDVDTFLQLVAREFEELIRENADLKQQIKKTEAERDEHLQREEQLRETMLAAQRVTEEMKANAQKEASLIVSEAELKAERLLAEGELNQSRLNDQILELKRQRVQFESAFKSLLDTHYKMLNLNEEQS